VDIMWQKYGKVEVFSMENGIYIFRFNDHELSCEAGLEEKIWRVANKPIILRKWEPRIRVWVKFMHLPMEFWTQKGLSRNHAKMCFFVRLGFLW
jgi:hypothetical protein